MTYIQSKHNGGRGIYRFLGLGVLLIVGIFASIGVYSQTVALRHDIIELSSKLDEIKIENAELKDNFYKLTDQKVLDKLAKDEGLIQDINPKWIFASQF